MKNRLNATASLVCAAAVVLLLGQSGHASDQDGGRLDGAWVMKMSSGLATLNHDLTFTAQEPDGPTYTAVMEHTECSATIFGMFPKATHQSDSIGIALKTGLNTLDYTVVGRGVKKGEFADEVVYISVLSGQMRLLDDNTMEGEATVAHYLASADADHDGLPDANQAPVICTFSTATAQRVAVTPPSEPTVVFATPPADANGCEVTMELVWITDPLTQPRNPIDAMLRIGDNEYSGKGTDSQYNWTDSTETTKGGFRVLTYDFGDLGVFELWERIDGEFKIIDMEGGHRYHLYEATGWMVRGTGAFVNAVGIIHTTYHNNYTWDPAVGPSEVREEIHAASHGMIRGIELPE